MSMSSFSTARQSESARRPAPALRCSLAVTLVVFACCDEATKAPADDRPAGTPPVVKGANEADATPPPRASTRYDDYADAALAIGYLLRADTPPWDEISAMYEVARPHITLVDQSNHTRYATEIPNALAQIKHGKDAEINTHVATKGLQHVTFLTISDLLDRVVGDDTRTASTSIDHIKAVFAVIRPTLQRRDATVYKNVPTLVPAADQALDRLQAAKNRPGLASAAMHLRSLLSKTYALSVLYEMKGVEEACGEANKRPADCAEKRTEAGMYFRIIKPMVAARNEAAATEVESLVNGSRPGPEYSTVRDLLARSLPFTVEELSF